MAQKIQFIVTILHKPKLLIFDEPFSGFDPINVNLLKDEIIKLKDSGATIIFSTHNMASVEELCDHIALINNSKMILSGEIHEIKNRFKSNIFEVVYRSAGTRDLLFESGNFSLVSSTKHNGNQVAMVQVPESVSPNEMLKQVLRQAEVVSFKEILPSVNDIFIGEVRRSEEASM